MGVAEGESATLCLWSLANPSIAKFIVKMYHLLYHQIIGLDELIFYISSSCMRVMILNSNTLKSKKRRFSFVTLLVERWSPTLQPCAFGRRGKRVVFVHFGFSTCGVRQIFTGFSPTKLHPLALIIYKKGNGACRYPYRHEKSGAGGSGYLHLSVLEVRFA